MTEAQIRTAIEEIYSRLYEGKIEWSNSFRTNGMDSLDYVEFYLEIESHFQIRISDEIAAQLKTPNDLVHVVVAAFNPELDRPIAR